MSNNLETKYLSFHGKLWIIGFGSIATGVVPLLLRHIDMTTDQIVVVAKDTDPYGCATKFNLHFIQVELTANNYLDIIDIHEGDFLLNLSCNVSSCDLVKLCTERNVPYLDTCVEPWDGGYFDPKLSETERSNYGLREACLSLRNFQKEKGKNPTTVACHGANPGMISHLLKQALLNLAKDTDFPVTKPTTKNEWAKLASDLGVKVIHIAERDTQISSIPRRRGEFVGTWSVEGFIGEGSQPSELGWGTHEKQLPSDGHRHPYGCDSAIYLERPGLSVNVRSWTPLEGSYLGFLVTHNESISISDYLTVKDDEGNVLYRPTVHYAYHPCGDTIQSIHELKGKMFDHHEMKLRIMTSDITEGVDELGVLLCGHKKNAYWFGSQLSIEQARDLVEFNGATTLQVTAAVMAGVIWALQNPNRGIVEAENMDFERILEIMNPYLGNIVGQYTDWTPLHKRGILFNEKLDLEDPWQFSNIRV